MNKNYSLSVVAFLLFLWSGTPLMAQFSVSGEFRPRLEYHDGYLKLRDSSKTGYPVLLGRNRLIVNYHNEKFDARFSVQHAYVFGENHYSSDTITKNTINIYEAWFRYSFTKHLGLKIGRTELIYDDGRVLGNSNWNAKGATHDVMIFQWQDGKELYRGDLGLAINNVAPAGPYLESYPLKNYKYMGYLYEQRKLFNKSITISFLGVVDVHQKSKSTNPELLYGRYTLGGTVGYAKSKLKLFAAGYYQGGKFKDGRSLTAGFAGGYASYQVLKPLSITVGYEFASGNDYSDTTGLKTKSRAFSTLYSNSHGFYGYMDLFNGMLSAGDGIGLTDFYARATVKVGEKTNIEACYRMIGMPNGYLPAGTATSPKYYLAVDKQLGTEIDLMVTHTIVKNFDVNAAYCFFLPTHTMERWNGLKPGTSTWAQYAYVMLTWKPVFFSADLK